MPTPTPQPADAAHRRLILHAVYSDKDMAVIMQMTPAMLRGLFPRFQISPKVWRATGAQMVDALSQLSGQHLLSESKSA